MFSKKSFLAPLAGLFLLFFFSCENSVNENNIVGVGGYVFPEATAVSKSFVSQVYMYDGSRVFSVTTYYLKEWESVPFLKFDDVCKLIASFNGRGYVPSVEGSLYKYNYDSAKTAALISAGWNSAWDSDTLYFDVDNQTVYSDDFTRIISSVNL
ncbi:MAG: hypothetical protein K6A42_02235, partial [Treponema sp.]|nr:hypothetical protein [Treponema sp.]